MPSPPTNNRYYSLDFWRGIACLSVVISHSAAGEAFRDTSLVASSADQLAFNWSSYLPRLPAGVPMFFVISGYCITASALTHQDRKQPAREFFLRRLRRIFPPLWIYLAIVLPLIGVLYLVWPQLIAGNPWGHPWALSHWNWFGSLTLTESWRHHVLGDARRHYLIGHIWTLCYEEQFYLIVGLTLLFAPRAFFLTLAAVTLIVRLLSWRMPPDAIHGFFFDGNWLAFAAGVAVYYAVQQATFVPRIAIALALVLIAGLQSNPTAFAFAALLVLIFPFDQRLHTAAWARPISACGVMCYSIYLTHLPLVEILSQAAAELGIRSHWAARLIVVSLCVAASVSVAVAFHRFVERRYMNSPDRAVPRTALEGVESALNTVPG